ncbi:hypothetical protein CHLNCDRAFT_137035 [Chlorella variabilis]|uniref:Aminotransferase class I/classII large domain-containing protein n=1 Tax=Chlorella variabilis TaxID=554065 RepID=E1ZLU7_CHLVA|nr:hypothetical protein CHLNCDRAFT_137035 [Chlorella variabilis]EFN53200.1 hypothetical protein CHLNCDRAFT_137035 [Chlorella variabilis]|eukprot:XP_005845302.1 hypothetical protein CHLNCDRAFT_137035 [Chlorella variabilis]
MAPAADTKVAADDRGGCSVRSDRLLKPALSYIAEFVKANAGGLWDAEKKKDGWIPLVVAENKLANSLVLERLEAAKGAPSSVLNYSSMKGMPECQAAMAGLLERHVVPGHKVEPGNVVIAAGAGALLDSLFWCICDAGEGVLIPAPYYPAFDNDLQVKCSVQPLPFYLKEGDPEAGPVAAAAIRAQLDGAVVSAAARGIAAIARPNMLSPRALPPLPTLPNLTPHSPLCYSFSACSDEVYALSMFKPEEAKFTSAITLAQQLVPPPPPEMKKQRSRLASFFSRQRSAAAGDSSDDSSSEEDSDEEEEVRAKKKAEREAKKAARAAKKAAAVEAAKKKAEEEEAARKAAEAAAEAAKVNGGLAPGFYSQEQVDTYVHLLYGLSKDFCASGLRVGALYTRNKRLQQALDPISVFTGVSGHTQWAVAQLLDDQEWVSGFLQQNQKLLRESYDVLAEALEEEKIPYVPAVAGMFVWIDLRKWLPEKKDWEAERKFWQRVCDDCKIILTPGHDCHAAEPGHFRLCFAWMPPVALKEAVQRLRKRVLEDEEEGECVIQ